MTTIWFAITLAITVGLLYAAWKNRSSKLAVTGIVVGLIMTFIYFMFLENIFARKFGGTLDVSVPKEEVFVGSTWKDQDYWMETWDPKTNTCYFREKSRFNTLNGEVRIKNCKPMAEYLSR